MFGKRLKLLRKKYRLTQKDLADKLGISPSSIGMFEQGRRQPDPEMLKKLSSLFNVTSDYMLGISDVSDMEENVTKVISTIFDENEYKLILKLRNLKEEEKKDIEDYINFKTTKQENKNLISSTSE